MNIGPGEALGGRDEHSLSTAFEAPRSELEALLARLWSSALKVWPIGIYDDFFELGGHSLLAAELLVGIQDAVGQEISARTLFLQPTIAELATVIGGPGDAEQGAG
jgi:acyl carrier protein